ncbi:MAG: DMT family transporter [Pseudomonadota bacterium]
MNSDFDLRKGIFFSLFSCFGIVCIFFLGKFALETIAVEVFLFFWFGLAFIYLSAYNLIFIKKNPFLILLKNKKTLIIYVIVEFIASYIFFYILKHLNPSFVSTLNISFTLFLFILGIIILKESFNSIEIIGALIALAGLIAVSYSGDFTFTIYAIIFILGNFIQAFNTIFITKLLRKEDPVLISQLRTLFLSIFALFFCLMNGNLVFPSNDGILFLSLGSFFGPCVNFLGFYFAIKYLEVSKVTVIRNTNPIFVIILSILFLNYYPEFKEIIGMICLLMGTVILVLGKRKK